jgi:hypothetical protein
MRSDHSPFSDSSPGSLILLRASSIRDPQDLVRDDERPASAGLFYWLEKAPIHRFWKRARAELSSLRQGLTAATWQRAGGGPPARRSPCRSS